MRHIESGVPGARWGARLRWVVALVAAMALVSVASAGTPASPEGHGFKAERIWDFDEPEWQALESSIRDAAERHFATRSTNFSILWANPDSPEPGRSWGSRPESWSVMVYDYAAEAAWMIRFDPAGRVVAENRFKQQPVPSEAEIDRALEILRKDSQFGPVLGRGLAEPYAAMPPVDYAPGAPRTLHIGLMPTDGTFTHQVVGVVMRTGAVITFEGGAPETSRAVAGSCGPASGSGCSTNSGGTGLIHVTWPEANPIWELDVRRPSRTQVSATPDGAGIELLNVKYNGELILAQANVPVLNVLYDGNTCGPYRDWLWQESCFDVTGGAAVPAEPGFYRGPETVATICVDGTDAGNFRGVGIQDRVDSLYLTSEMSAGWYRYLIGWVLKADGSISAEFYYAGTFNSCTCNNRTHHAYWRLDWAIGGTDEGGGVTAPLKLQKRTSVVTPWVDVPTEMTALRTLGEGVAEYRVINTESNVSYEILPTKDDSTAAGDSFGVSDVWALKYKAGSETHDTGGAAINLSSFTNAEDIDNQRFVMWYGGHLRQDTGGGGGGGKTCVTFGPLLLRSTPTPSVTFVSSATANPTNGATADFTVGFSAPVSGVDPSDFVLTTTGVVGASIGTLSGAGATRTISVNTGTGDGTIRLDLIDDDSITSDDSGIPIGGVGAGNGNYTNGQVLTVDKSVPTAVIEPILPDVTNANSLPFRVTFSEDIGASFGPADVTVTGTLSVGASFGISGANPVFTVNVTPQNPNAEGTLGIDVGVGVTDLAGNPFGGGSTIQVYTVDNTAPTGDIALTGKSPTEADTVEFSATFNESVGDSFAPEDVTVTGTLASGATVEVTGSETNWTIRVTPSNPFANGTIGIQIGAGVTDVAGNPFGGATSPGEYSIQNAVGSTGVVVGFALPEQGGHD